MLYLGSDHRGYEMKEKLKVWLEERDVEYEDCGPFAYDKNDDFPDFAKSVAGKVVADAGSRGILICGSGIGIAIAANKIKGIRAGTASSPEQAAAAVHDEDMNILALSSDFTTEDVIMKTAEAFIGAKFIDEERYRRRIMKLE